MPLKDVTADFTFKNGKVMVSPFIARSNDIEMAIGGIPWIRPVAGLRGQLKIAAPAIGQEGNRVCEKCGCAGCG